MKINKWGIRVSYVLSILSLLGSIFFTNSWWENFSFAILGGSLFSNIICIVNYIILLKETAEEIVMGVYSFNMFGFASLYSEKKDITLKQSVETLSILNDKMYYVYAKISNLTKSLFWCDLRKKKTKELKDLIDKSLVYIYDIESYIEVNEKEAGNNTKHIYKDLDKFIDNNKIYFDALKLARSFHSDIMSLEEYDDKIKIKERCAERYKNSIKK